MVATFLIMIADSSLFTADAYLEVKLWAIALEIED